MSLTLPQLLAMKLQQQNQQPQQVQQPLSAASMGAAQNADNAQQALQNTGIMNMMNNNTQGMYSGLSNAGNDVLGALMLNKMNQNQQNAPLAQAMVDRGQVPDLQSANNILNPSAAAQAGSWLSNLFGLGGGS